MSESINTITVVCRGNIARSPFAAKIIEQELTNHELTDKFRVISRGTQGTTADAEPVKYPNITHYGKIYTEAKPTLERYGVDLSDHRSTIVDEPSVACAGVVLAMEQRVKDALDELFPQYSEKICLFSELSGEHLDVPDPEKLRGEEEQERVYTEIRNTILEGFPRLIELAQRSPAL